jgi:3-dehydroquinate synthase
LQHIGGKDPFETGCSRPLDFGHWSAHKLEQLTGYRLRHGEAVASGIALDATYSYLNGMLSEPEWQRVIDLLQALGFVLYVPEMETGAHAPGVGLWDGLSEFREHLGGELTIMLLEQIGRGVEVHRMEAPLILRSIQLLKQLNGEVKRTDSVVTSPDRETLWTSSAPARLQ